MFSDEELYDNGDFGSTLKSLRLCISGEGLLLYILCDHIKQYAYYAPDGIMRKPTHASGLSTKGPHITMREVVWYNRLVLVLSNKVHRFP